MPSWYSWQGNDLLLNISVQPRAARDEICGILGDKLKIRITAPPVDGKANTHLIAFLAKQCGVARSHVSLVSGESSRQKRLRLNLQKPNLPVVLAPFC
ncbi:MAG: DUF167 family protein [Gammaproteobacteria bacterium]|jgi:uncharacterized protein